MAIPCCVAMYRNADLQTGASQKHHYISGTVPRKIQNDQKPVSYSLNLATTVQNKLILRGRMENKPEFKNWRANLPVSRTQPRTARMEPRPPSWMCYFGH